jgi:hypothetical protein
MDQCHLDVMLSVKTLPYPPGFYGRALSVGLALEAEVGWEHLKRLSGSFDAAGQPDVKAWRSTLGEKSARVSEIVTP